MLRFAGFARLSLLSLKTWFGGAQTCEIVPQVALLYLRCLGGYWS